VDYARVLIDRQKYLRGHEEIQSLLALEPDNRDYLALHAAACVGLGEYDTAIAEYRRLLAGSPSAEFYVSLGHCLKTIGLQMEAAGSYQLAAAARSGFGDACWSLANLQTWRFSTKDIAQMRSEEAAPGANPVDRCHLCFALGKALEDRNEYAESWQF
jgi:tetratricopeptide (TPR) repeat protein